MVSLPKRWVTNHCAQKKIVSVTWNMDNSLIIASGRHPLMSPEHVVIDYGFRRVHLIGGSFMFALPISWARSQCPFLETVVVVEEKQNTLRIAASTPRQEYPGRST